MILTLVTFWSGNALADGETAFHRQINFKLQNTHQNIKETRCKTRILGQCVEWEEYQNTRTKVGWDEQTSGQALEALKIVSNRMLDDRIWTCALDKSARFFVKSSHVPLNDYDQFREFSWHQRNALMYRGFPVVNVLIDNLTPPRRGQAYVGRYVDARLTPEGFTVGGTYNFTIDQATIANEDALTIAGIMAHEMLHQMGHNHPNGYDDGNFVSTFQNCFVNDGSFALSGYGLLENGRPGIVPQTGCTEL